MAEVTRFPPLSAIPAPPAIDPDKRQRTFQRIVGGLTGRLFEGGGRVGVANTTHGYHASAVDLGALQEMLGGAIVRFDISQVHERWDEDLFEWMRRAIFTWVQRCKMLQMTIEERGIRIVMETQDDHGYYRYEFSVFPGVKENRANQHE